METIVDVTSDSLVMPEVKKAGFWKRFFAFLIDYTLLTVISAIWAFLELFIFRMNGLIFNRWSMVLIEDFGDAIGLNGIVGVMFLLSIVLTVVGLIYFVLIPTFFKATLGMKALGIKIIKRNGQTLQKRNFGILAIRGFLMVLSVQLLPFAIISAIMVGQNKERLALHDIICKTAVVEK